MNKWVGKALLGIGGVICLYIVFVIVGLLFFLFSSNERDNSNPARQVEMVNTALVWGRLAPFPEDIQDFKIRTEGGAFSRTFKGSFSCSPDALESWIQESPGLNDAKIETLSKTIKRYVISPGGGAGYAEVIIDFSINHVSFKMYWS